MTRRYSADAGIEYGIWHLEHGRTDVPEFTINDDGVRVTIEYQGDQTYRIISTATGGDESSTTIASLVRVTTSGDSVFNYAAVSLNGEIRMDQDARVYSDEYPDLDGNIFAHGNIDLNNYAIIDGDAVATGTIDVAVGARVNGLQSPGSDPLPGLAEQQIQMDSLISGWKAAAQNQGCDALTCVAYTYTGNNWQPSAGTYVNAQHAKKNMTISAWSGAWIFQESVCAGVDTNRDLTISGSPVVTFRGPVKVGRNLIISGSGTTVIFEGQVCVGNNLQISEDTTVVFRGPVHVGNDLSLSGGSGTVTFQDRVYAGRNINITDEKTVTLGGIVYAANNINLSKAARITGGQNIIADNTVSLAGWSSKVNPGVDAAGIPFLVSTGGSVTIDDANETTALIYAPNGAIVIRGYDSLLYGAAVGRSVRLMEWGPNELVYPVELRDRAGLPGGGGGGGVSITVLTWG
jgi:cytoskeletal protein CcmA (bactofilin family)